MNPVQDRELYYRENQEYLNKRYINLPLTLNFIREFKEKMEWNYVLTHMRLSVAFLEEMIDYIDWNKLETDALTNIPDSFIIRHRDLFDERYKIYEGLIKGTVIDTYTDDLWNFIKQCGRTIHV